MKPRINKEYVAFDDAKLIGQGDVFEVSKKVKKHLLKEPKSQIMIFDSEDSSQIEIDFRGSEEKVLERLQELFDTTATETQTGPGRPKLGVISKEISLLPEHWDWLAIQPSSASATLRKLIDEAKKKNKAEDKVRVSQNATYKFMNVMAGNLPLYEDALRALYAKNELLFTTIIAPWPKAIKSHITNLSKNAFL